MAISPKFATIGLIGPGRMGSALAESLCLNGQPIHAIAGRSDSCPKTRALAQRLNAVPMTVQALARDCSLIFIATPDDEIVPLTNAIEWSPGTAVVHLSGATDISALQAASNQQAHVGSFHPLQSISQPIGAATTFKGCTVTIEAPEPTLRDRLAALALVLGSRVNVLPAHARMRYHAAANHASALLIALLADMVQLWESWGSSEEEMMKALLPLMQSTLMAAKENGVASALTGPLARGDIGTLSGHLKALKQIDPALAQRYALHHQPLLSCAPSAERQRITDLIHAYSPPTTPR